ncbi:unnamed protein product [Anisakis simplex]|uniref:Putative extracellular sulfatase Sulf-1 homolog (inferred by orthology to a C. elegans protein) n=1 Tax=Anisakis simplex TaxID=6269 RepID=A0A0M3K493_ANISI|nr:unnamed protein product [Anisakis simplex]
MEPIHVVFTDVLHRRRLQTLQSVDHNILRIVNELRDIGELSNTYIIYTSDHGYHLGQFGLVKGKNMPYEFDIKVPPHMDGRSLLPLIHEHYEKKRKRSNHRASKQQIPLNWRHTVLIERGKMAKLTKIRDRMQKQRDRFGKDARVRQACSRPEFRHPCQNDQKEILESGQWFQGVFDDEDDNDTDNEDDKRSKRSIKHRKKRKKERDLNVGPMCTHSQSNKSVLCEPIVFEDSRVWAMHKTKVDDRIENLRKRLNRFKDLRRVLKRGRPHLSDDPTTSQAINNNYNHTISNNHNNNKNDDNNNSELCECSAQANPIQSDDVFDENKYNDGKHKTNYRKHHQYGTKKWFREDTKQNCNVPQMNCFVHGADHWRTPPLWPSLYGEFCFCQNSNNNTYWCLRTINETHNFLYCEFITEFISFYDINSDPYQLHNSVWSIPVGVLEQLSNQLEKLRSCRGYEQCEHYASPSWNLPFEASTNDIK